MLTTLPTEILLTIANYCLVTSDNKRDLISLSRASRRLNDVAQAGLHRDVEFIRLDELLKFVTRIIRRPHLRGCTRNITLHFAFLGGAFKGRIQQAVTREGRLWCLADDLVAALEEHEPQLASETFVDRNIFGASQEILKPCVRELLLRQVVGMLPALLPSLRELKVTGAAREETVAAFSNPRWSPTSLPLLKRVTICFMDHESLVRFPPLPTTVSSVLGLATARLKARDVTFKGLYISPSVFRPNPDANSCLALRHLVLEDSELTLGHLRDLLGQCPDLKSLCIRSCTLHDQSMGLRSPGNSPLMSAIQPVRDRLENLCLERIQIKPLMPTVRSPMPAHPLQSASFSHFPRLHTLRLGIDASVFSNGDSDETDLCQVPVPRTSWSQSLPSGLRHLTLVDDNDYRRFCPSEQTLSSIESLCKRFDGMLEDRVQGRSLVDLERVDVYFSQKRRLGLDWQDGRVLMAKVQERFKREGVRVEVVLRSWLFSGE